MRDNEVKRFLAQFDNARKDFATWPKWMRDAAYVATANFPKRPSAPHGGGR